VAFARRTSRIAQNCANFFGASRASSRCTRRFADSENEEPAVVAAGSGVACRESGRRQWSSSSSSSA
jgi:hypothetical protein